jgi:HlyD family secretion protein
MTPAERIPSEPTRLTPRRSRTRTIAIAAAVLAAIVAAIVAWRATRPAPAPKYETARVERGRVVAQVTATGTLSALVTVQVGSQVSGRIAKLYVDFNSPVKKGQLIAKIDPELFQATRDQARANHVAARADLSRAKVQSAEAARQLTRTRSLAERKLVAEADLDTAQANADAASAAVESATGKVAQAQAALQQAEVNLAYTSIVSPIDGTVISRSVDVGQTVAASLQAPTLFVIAEDLSKMQVDTSVAEADIGKLRPGMEATFGVDAFPGRRFAGKVRQIRNAAQTVQNVVTYDAVVDVSNPDLELRPGMTANVSFIHADRQDVLKVPNAALRFRPPPELSGGGRKGDGGGAEGGGGGGGRAQAQAQTPGAPGTQASGAAGPGGPGGGGRRAAAGEGGAREPDRRTVWVLRGEKPEPVRIRTGVSDGSATEVIEGELREGDAAVTDAASGDQKPGGGGGPRTGGPPRIL